MARIENQESELVPIRSRQQLIEAIATKAYGLALTTTAELGALRQQIKNAGVTLDDQEFKALSKQNLANAAKELRDNDPELARWIGSTIDFMESGQN